MPWRTALDGTLGGWQFVSNSSLVGAPFYRWCMGTDQLRLNVILMLASASAWAAGIAILALIASVVRNQRRVAIYLAAALACAIAMVLLLDDKHSPDMRRQHRARVAAGHGGCGVRVGVAGLATAPRGGDGPRCSSRIVRNPVAGSVVQDPVLRTHVALWIQVLAALPG